MAYRNDWIRQIRQLATKYGVDPRAALAVASTEGLSGGVGDRGTSYGAFQLHVGGALPKGKDRAWAESPAGLDYAMRQIAGVSKGLTGQAAINAIVRKFERPADPDGQVAKALAAYGSFAGGPGGPAGPAVPGVPGAPAALRQIPSNVLAVVNQSLAGGASPPPSLASMRLPKFHPKSLSLPGAPSPAAAPGTPLPIPAVNGSSQFGQQDPEGAPSANGARYHAAYDWMLGPDKPVPALVGGTVIEVKGSRGSSGQIYGGVVKIQTPDGRVLVYRHITPNVRVGQKIGRGQSVAHVTRWNDNPGSSHAHIEWWKTLAGGYRYENMSDPLSLINQGTK